MPPTNHNTKSLKAWTRDAACSMRGTTDAPKFNDYILPLIFTKRLCAVSKTKQSTFPTDCPKLHSITA